MLHRDLHEAEAGDVWFTSPRCHSIERLAEAWYEVGSRGRSGPPSQRKGTKDGANSQNLAKHPDSCQFSARYERGQEGPERPLESDRK